VPDQQVAIQGSTERVEGVDQVSATNRTGLFPQSRIDHEQRHHLPVPVLASGLHCREQRRIVVQAQVSSEPQDCRHLATVGARACGRTRN